LRQTHAKKEIPRWFPAEVSFALGRSSRLTKESTVAVVVDVVAAAVVVVAGPARTMPDRRTFVVRAVGDLVGRSAEGAVGVGVGGDGAAADCSI